VSHISKIEVEINDLDCLKQACRELGFEYRSNQKTYQWFGRKIGDEPLPENISEDELGQCDSAIHIDGCEYEIGVVKNGNRWILLWDSYIKGGLAKRIGQNAGTLKQAYSIARIKKEARLKGYRLTEKKMKQGVRLVLAV